MTALDRVASPPPALTARLRQPIITLIAAVQTSRPSAEISSTMGRASPGNRLFPLATTSSSTSAAPTQTSQGGKACTRQLSHEAAAIMMPRIGSLKVSISALSSNRVRMTAASWVAAM